ncbi:Filament-like plant protein [Sesamum angolense]|uniref:Filament-like plant protein n=1 Tax=Sesamum angolense TaxID=2727404 RepID=A0AAE1WD76_9LAMI|nr:Filament-like plant protein [Sesamum angolense]
MAMKKTSERSPGESESSGSFSSNSERYSDEQDALRESANDSTQSPEVTSKASMTDDGVKESWEKAENEVALLKQQVEVAVQQNVNLEVRVSHLDGALKECVRQLRQARDEQEKRISDAIAEKPQTGNPQRLNLRSKSLSSRPQQKLPELKVLLLLIANRSLFLRLWRKRTHS